jgi:hypothetical protein
MKDTMKSVSSFSSAPLLHPGISQGPRPNEPMPGNPQVASILSVPMAPASGNPPVAVASHSSAKKGVKRTDVLRPHPAKRYKTDFPFQLISKSGCTPFDFISLESNIAIGINFERSSMENSEWILAASNVVKTSVGFKRNHKPMPDWVQMRISLEGAPGYEHHPLNYYITGTERCKLEWQRKEDIWRAETKIKLTRIQPHNDSHPYIFMVMIGTKEVEDEYAIYRSSFDFIIRQRTPSSAMRKRESYHRRKEASSTSTSTSTSTSIKTQHQHQDPRPTLPLDPPLVWTRTPPLTQNAPFPQQQPLIPLFLMPSSIPEARRERSRGARSESTSFMCTLPIWHPKESESTLSGA